MDYFQIKLPIPPKPVNSWDPIYCSNQHQLSNNNLTVTKTSGGISWNGGVLGTVPNPKNFKVRILNRGVGNVMVGLAPRNKFNVNSANYNICGWYLYIQNGTLHSQQGDKSRLYSNSGIQNGSIIEVLYDEIKNTISFVVDGTNKGIAFTINTNDPIYPALDICDQNVSLEILN